MKKILLIVCTLALMVSLTACDSKFDGSRIGNDSEFIMEYRVLNTTDTQDLIAESGDIISGNIILILPIPKQPLRQYISRNLVQKIVMLPVPNH